MHLKLSTDSPAALKRKTERGRESERERKKRKRERERVRWNEATEKSTNGKKGRERRREGTTRWTISGTPLPHDAFITATTPRRSLPRFRDSETPSRAREGKREKERGLTKGRKWNKARARSSKLLRRADGQAFVLDKKWEFKRGKNTRDEC